MMLTETFNTGSRLLISWEGNCQIAELNLMGLARVTGVSGTCWLHRQCSPPEAAVSAPAPTLISLPFLFISSWLRICFVHMASAGKGLHGWGLLPHSSRTPGWTFP